MKLPSALALFCCTLTLTLLLLPCNSISHDATILLNIKMEDWKDSHQVLTDWNASHQNPCRWKGIYCNTFDAVTRVDLSSALISGNLSSAICGLASLEALILQGNAFTGRFPHGLLECKRLRVLDLSDNLFTGSLPNRIYELSELRLLRLSDNTFSGSIPPSFGMLPKLEALLFHGNSLNGTIPAFLGNLTTLMNFTIGDNPLQPGVIPTELGNLKRLLQLWLYNCNLVAKIPTVLSNLTQLEELDMSQNHLSGNIPTSLMGLSNLRELFLYENNLSGQIPANIDELRSLSSLDLSANHLTGEIPDIIANLTFLNSLLLFDNQLTGEVPSQLGKLRFLSYLKLYRNKLGGWLPQSLGTYSDVILVDIAGNKFEGPLPNNLCRGGVLYGLSAFSNKFNGTLPSTLEDCKSLRYLQLSDNQLTGEIPAGLWSTQILEQLFLHNNKFEGEISGAIGQAKNLIRLELSNNRFRGRIPPRIGQLTKLQVFKGSNNRFSGPISNELAGLSSMTILWLDDNLLTGEIPKDIMLLKKLSQVNLSNNRLTGKIPASLGDIQSLDLSNNLLSGEIPPELGRHRFDVFNLSRNHLSGPIPDGLDTTAFKKGFLDNPGLCGGRYLMLPSCSSSHKFSLQRLVTIVVPPLFLAALAMCFICVCCSSLRKPGRTPSWKLTPFHSREMELDESYILRNLKESNVIGFGSSGKVYKLTLYSGRTVAVKKIRNVIRSAGFKRKPQQQREELVEVEVDTLGVIRHANIIKLLCCISSEESDFKLLVYEYMPNCSLFERLHDGQGPEMALPWSIRYNIAVGTARGLSYLHHDCSPLILHRDVKSSNILLDVHFEAKIADFGLSKLLDRLGDEYCVSGYVGSHGYIAPEYADRLKVSEKSDVYSFGVVLLELVSGMKATGEVEYGDGLDIVEWIRNTIWKGKAELGVLDWQILEENCVEQMMRVLRVGMICTQRAPTQRPTMREVVEMLVQCNDEKLARDRPIFQHLKRNASFVPTATPSRSHFNSENEMIYFSDLDA